MWLALGDFNNGLHPSEKVGGNKQKWRRMHDFNNCLVNCGLDDLGFCGSSFTWNNRQYAFSFICERLDRVLVHIVFGLVYFPALLLDI